MKPFDTYEHAGVTVELYYDEDPMSPLTDHDGVPSIVSFTPDFDGNEYLSVEEDLTLECEQCGGSGLEPNREVATSDEAICSRCEGEGTVRVTLAEYMRAGFEGDVVIPLRYDDYGARGSRLVPADSENANAAVYVTPEQLRDEWSGSREQAEAYMRAYVGEVDAWLRGEVYGYVIKGPNGEDLEPPFYDSCWGFIGDLSYVKAEANRAAEGVAESLASEQREACAMAARDIETVEVY